MSVSSEKDGGADTVDETNKTEPDPGRSAPTLKARELLARHYSDRFWSSLSSTGTALLAWLAALLLIWAGYILPLPEKLAHLVTTSKQVQNDKGKLEAWNQAWVQSSKADELAKRVEPAGIVASPQPIQPEAVDLQEDLNGIGAPSRIDEDKLRKLVAEQTQKDNFERKLQETERAGEDLSEDLDKIDTPLGTLEINKKFVPALWALLFAGLFTFYAQRRVLLLAMIGRAIGIHTSELGDRIEDLGGLGAWAPFWLAPLPPATRDSRVSREEVRTVLGWGPRDGWRSVASSLVLAALLGLYIYVLFVSWTIIDLAGKGDGQLRVLTLVVLGLLYCLVLTGLRWRPICYDGFPDRMLAELPGRRAFLGATGTVALAGLAILASPRLVISALLPGKSLRAPRYRKPAIRNRLEPLAAAYRDSFRLNRSSNIVHYVDWEGWSAGAEGMAERNLSPVERKQAISLLLQSKLKPVAPKGDPGENGKNQKPEERLNEWQTGAMAERLALEAARQNNLDLALNLLWKGIEHDRAFKRLNLNKPSYRLYDFYARLSVRAGRLGSKDWQKFLQSVREQSPRDATLQQRLARWESLPELLLRDRRLKERWTGEKLLWSLPEKRPSKRPSSKMS